MTSELTKQDLEMLLGMEIKLRLLDTEGVEIPENPPPIPKEPPNYDFAYSLWYNQDANFYLNSAEWLTQARLDQNWLVQNWPWFGFEQSSDAVWKIYII